MKPETSTPLLVVIVIAALSFAQDILLPFALAFLLSFLLTPFASRLERWVGRVASVFLVVLAAVGFFVSSAGSYRANFSIWPASFPSIGKTSTRRSGLYNPSRTVG